MIIKDIFAKPIDRDIKGVIKVGQDDNANIRQELEAVLPGGDKRQQMLSDYEDVHQRLGESHAPDEAARIMIELLKCKNLKI